MVEALKFQLRDLSVTFRLGETVESVTAGSGGTVTALASGKRIPADCVLYSAGRQGSTDGLDLAAAGLEADRRGRLQVDKQFRTGVEHIYAVGDVIGFPALAATSQEQGRLAAYHAFGEPISSLLELQPIGIYTIPEISYCGDTEDQLTTAGVPYEVGVARYRELARGQIVGDSYGMLKLLVSTEDRKVLGVHVFGTGATEIIHIGQAIMTTRRHRGPPGRHGVQLPDALGGLQGRGPRRDEQDAGRRAVRVLTIAGSGDSGSEDAAAKIGPTVPARARTAW